MRIGHGREYHVAAHLPEHAPVLLGMPRIPFEVLLVVELERVHEDAGHHGVGVLAGMAHEGEVAFVQRAHGGDEGDTPGIPALGRRPKSSLCGVGGEFQKRRYKGAKLRSSLNIGEFVYTFVVPIPRTLQMSLKNAKVLTISQNIHPFTDGSGMAKATRQLPQGILEKGNEIRVFMPKFGSINERRHQLHEVIRLSGMNLIINDTDHALLIKVASVPSARMQVYFIDNEEYFKRKATIEDDDEVFFPDNDERALR